MPGLTQVLQISLTVLLCLAAGVFAQAEGNTPIPILTLPIAVLALVFVDLTKQVKIPEWIANWVGLLAFLGAAWEFWALGGESKLLAGGHLLVYLTWVLVSLPKNPKRIWTLCGLSVLQIAVASVLTHDAWLGVALSVYALVAMWTLAVFSLSRASQLVERDAQSPDVVSSSLFTFPKSKPSAPSTFASYQHGITRQDLSRWITGRFILAGFLVAAAALGVAGACFLFTPRVWLGQLNFFENSPEGGRPFTGFTDHVQLGEMGLILESSDLVMEVEFADDSTRKLLTPAEVDKLLGEPYFRGAVSGTYAEGRWSRTGESSSQLTPLQMREMVQSSPAIVASRSPQTKFSGTVLRQRVRLQPISTDRLFAVGNAIACFPNRKPVDFNINLDRLVNDWSEMMVDLDTRELFLAGESAQPLEYIAISAPANSPETFQEFDRHRRAMRGQKRRYEFQADLQLPRLPEVRRIVEARLRQLGPPASLTPQLVADDFTHWLNGPEFGYTLNLSIKDHSLDPVEDFLVNRKKGHCEYFASALALMLRASAIPARLVTGFKGGEWNQKTQKLEVRQLHAHAWVEAFHDGRWITYDPTPGRDFSTHDLAKSSTGWKEIAKRLKSVWTQSMQLNQNQQRELIYEPVSGLASEFTNLFADYKQVLPFWANLLESPGNWFSWVGGVVASTLCLLFAGLWWTTKRLWRFLRTYVHREEQLRRQQVQFVPFYERFQKLLSEVGIHPRPTQTQREFALGAVTQLEQLVRPLGSDQRTASMEPLVSSKPEADNKADVQRIGNSEPLPENWAANLIESFYRVRFGEVALPEEEVLALDRQLDQLEHNLRQ